LTCIAAYGWRSIRRQNSVNTIAAISTNVSKSITLTCIPASPNAVIDSAALHTCRAIRHVRISD